MATARDNLRNARNKVLLKANQAGVDLTAERQKPGSNARSVAQAAMRMLNDSVSRPDREQLLTVSPPAGAFDGVNKTFTLPEPVRGLNLAVIFNDVSAATGNPLIRTDNPTPGTGTFFFDINAPTVIVVGDAPDAGDNLVVVYKPVR